MFQSCLPHHIIFFEENPTISIIKNVYFGLVHHVFTLFWPMHVLSYFYYSRKNYKQKKFNIYFISNKLKGQCFHEVWFMLTVEVLMDRLPIMLYLIFIIFLNLLHIVDLLVVDEGTKFYGRLRQYHLMSFTCSWADFMLLGSRAWLYHFRTSAAQGAWSSFLINRF